MQSWPRMRGEWSEEGRNCTRRRHRVLPRNDVTRGSSSGITCADINGVEDTHASRHTPGVSRWRLCTNAHQGILPNRILCKGTRRYLTANHHNLSPRRWKKPSTWKNESNHPRSTLQNSHFCSEKSWHSHKSSETVRLRENGKSDMFNWIACDESGWLWQVAQLLDGIWLAHKVFAFLWHSRKMEPEILSPV
jgi:hypothetical protein